MNTNIAGQTRVLHELGINLDKCESTFLYEEYHSNQDKLLQKMKTCDEYTKIEKSRIDQQRIDKEAEVKSLKFQLKTVLLPYGIPLSIFILIAVITYFIEKYFRAPESN